eukprot:8280887-Alexandrium_andersonii.AAC.1
MQPGRRMCNSALPHAQQENAADAEPPVLAAATGTVAQMPPEMMASPPLRWAIATVHVAAARTGGSARAAFSCCAC